MEVIKMKLADLVKPEKNVRIHTEQQLKEFQRSVSMFGQIRPIVVDENNVILAGNGLYDTLVAMGMESADVYRYENLTENQKKKLMIADNKIFSLGIENLDTLNCFLEELQGDLDVPGFDEEMLRQLMADEDEITKAISEYGKIEEDEVTAIREKTQRKEAIIQQNLDNQEKTETTGDTGLMMNEAAIKDIKPQEQIIQEERKFIECPKCGERIWL